MNTGRKVFVYRNLHRDCWSVRDWKTCKVIFWAEHLTLTDCTFKVSEAGRKRVLAERRKNVHAGVVGFLSETAHKKDATRDAQRVSYNPYKCGDFLVVNTNRAVKTAQVAFLTPNGVFIK